MTKDDDLLPTNKLIDHFHRVTVKDDVFKKLGDIRAKHHLWDREAAIIFLFDYYEGRDREVMKLKRLIMDLEHELESYKKQDTGVR